MSSFDSGFLSIALALDAIWSLPTRIRYRTRLPKMAQPMQLKNLQNDYFSAIASCAPGQRRTRARKVILNISSRLLPRLRRYPCTEKTPARSGADTAPGGTYEPKRRRR